MYRPYRSIIACIASQHCIAPLVLTRFFCSSRLRARSFTSPLRWSLFISLPSHVQQRTASTIHSRTRPSSARRLAKTKCATTTHRHSRTKHRRGEPTVTLTYSSCTSDRDFAPLQPTPRAPAALPPLIASLLTAHSTLLIALQTLLSTLLTYHHHAIFSTPEGYSALTLLTSLLTISRAISTLVFESAVASRAAHELAKHLWEDSSHPLAIGTGLRRAERDKRVQNYFARRVRLSQRCEAVKAMAWRFADVISEEGERLKFALDGSSFPSRLQSAGIQLITTFRRGSRRSACRAFFASIVAHIPSSSSFPSIRQPVASRDTRALVHLLRFRICFLVRPLAIDEPMGGSWEEGRRSGQEYEKRDGGVVELVLRARVGREGELGDRGAERLERMGVERGCE